MTRFKIIIYSDSQSQRRRLQGLLLGHNRHLQIRLAQSAQEVRGPIDAGQCDMLVTELRVENRPLPEFLPSLSDKISECLVLAVGRSPSAEMLIQCFRAGMTDFVPSEQIDYKLAERICHGLEHRKQHNRITRRIERRQTELLRLAEQDQLTGLFNRRYLDRLIRANSFRNDRRRDMSCVFVDLDHFKHINDTYGHAVGDKVLKSVAQLLQEQCGGGDAAIRWGGEEFVILRASTDMADGWGWACQIRDRIAQLRFSTDEISFEVTASVGLSSFATQQMGYDKIDQADRAMLLAKRTGRNRVCTWPMVWMDEAISKVLSGCRLRPDARWVELIESIRGQMGAEQLRHLTTHTRRVEAIAVWIGTVLDLPAGTRENIRLACLCHDLAKALIPEDLLAQEKPLTKPQRDLMDAHADLSADLARSLGLDGNAVEYIRNHHGRYDQTRSGTRRSLGASILAVADALAAMCGHRPYGPVRTSQEAISELMEQSGKQFHPAVVSAICQAACSGAPSSAA